MLVGALVLLSGPQQPARAQPQTIKIGILFDQTGPFSAAGSLNGWRGTKMIIDYVNERDGRDEDQRQDDACGLHAAMTSCERRKVAVT